MTEPRGGVDFTYGDGIRIATFHGTVGDTEVMAAYEALLATPGYTPDLDDLVDLRPVGRLEVSTTALRQLIGLFEPIDRLGIRSRTAIVAGSDFTFGMSRMYELLRGDDKPDEVRVFRQFDAATEWLRGPRP